jgi:glycosyltransferase involved in cell wall biosynthesis
LALNATGRKSILIDARVISTGQGHGISTYAEHLIEHLSLAPSRFKFILLVCKNSPLLKNQWPDHVTFYKMRTSWLNLFLGQLELFWVIRKLKPSLVHSPSFVVPLLGRTNLVTTIHDLNHVVLAENYTVFHRMYYNVLLRNRLQKSSKIITVSHFSKNEILKFFHVRLDQISVIYNGVSDRYHHTVRNNLERVEKVRRKYELPLEFVFTSGNKKPHKNLKNFVQAYCESDLGLPLVILSEFDESILQPSLTYNKKHLIHFLRYVDLDDLPFVYALSKVFAFTSLYEGFGLPPLEAFACGTPVVVSARTSLPEILPPNVHFVDPENSESIKAGVKDAMTKSHSSSPGQIAEWLQCFDWRKNALKTLSIYEEVLGEF